MQGMEFVKYGK